MEIDPRYPIGKFTRPAVIDETMRDQFIAEIATAPSALLAAVAGLDERQIDTPYRDGGWTVRQLVHHLPDSHVNAYVRFKLALTEDEPTIKTYEEQWWAELPDARLGPLQPSLDLLSALHKRWVACCREITPESFSRKLRHPDHGLMTLDELLAMYAWHGRHHVEQILGLLRRKGW
jgi:uncharacterized damage-inducible protein DinB